ncbi:hypothetical protein RIVM261_041580 [Rivularia sp. IAM M-261]|nr:hypothetical protein RIVM261_041580 [Rivularia sp. IAM M-261]
MIRISINLEFGDGNFERGFAKNQINVTIATLKSKLMQLAIQLSPSPEIPKLYQAWKQQYYSILLKNPHRGFKMHRVAFPYKIVRNKQRHYGASCMSGYNR